MKKKIIIILLAITIGGVLAFFTLSRIERKNKTENVITLTVLQTGVFSDYENAVEQKESMNNAIILEDNGLYRVIVGASTNESGLSKIEKILESQKIHYYKKELTVLESDSEQFSKYNLLLEKANSEESVLLLNQKILESMELS
ncbi:TPA: hypothetical protein IAB95_03590 [Candidatus Ventrenecus avicola]|nr:hypothetical protein [Candidatus Ventrenecus avicola]